MFRDTRSFIIGILLLIVGGLIGFKYGQTGLLPFGISPSALHLPASQAQIVKSNPPSQFKNANLDTFWQVYGELQQNYLRTEGLDPVKMMDGATAGMTAALGDPYTAYLPPDTNTRFAADIAGAFDGVGIELGYKDNTLAVVAPLENSPAKAAGVQAGDLILHISDPSKNVDKDTSGWTLDEAVNQIRGTAGTEITLTLLRDGTNEPFKVTLKRQEIVIKTVTLSYVNQGSKKIALIKLNRFGDRTQSEWDDAVNQIVADPQVKGIMLDMRNNPGGLFDEAINIASDFVPKGVVVKQRGKFSTQDFMAKGNPRLAKYPVAVLVNKGSASAAEIVAGALKDDLSAKLYGEKTFGKGTVQDTKDLPNGGGLHVTIAEWLLPKGESIHGVGIDVDVPVADDPKTPDDEVVLKAETGF